MVADPTIATSDVRLDCSRKHRALSRNIRLLADQLWAIVQAKALQSGFPIHSAELDVDEDPVEGIAKAVIFVSSSASASEVFAFWDGLGWDMERWVAKLDPKSREAAMERLVLHFSWSD